MEDSVPKIIGRYTVDRLLGAGAMGFVYLGRDPDLDRPVAIKTVRHFDLDEDARKQFLERFRNEARAAARLQNANIVQVYDVGEESGIGPYLVFEYVAGSTLKKVLKTEGALSPAAVLRLADEVSEALHVAHEAGIIHRDIKPDNLLVTPDGATKLADFGVARVPNAALTREGQFLGTPCYAAPETLGEGAYSVQSDLFSFAAVLYEAACGRRAFPGDEALAVAHKVIHDTPLSPRQLADHPSTIPEEVNDILLQALSKNPQERARTARELAADLREAYFASGLVEEEGRPPSRRVALASPPVQAHRREGLWVALGLVFVAGVAVIFWLTSDTVNPPVIQDEDASEQLDVLPLDAGVDVPDDVSTDTAAEDVLVDTLADVDAAEVDVLADAPEDITPDVPNLESMTPHDREEAAKDALDRAREALDTGDAEGATRALAEATLLDPGNPDIETLRAELASDGL